MELAHFGPNPVYGNGGTSGSPDSALLHLPGAPRADNCTFVKVLTIVPSEQLVSTSWPIWICGSKLKFGNCANNMVYFTYDSTIPSGARPGPDIQVAISSPGILSLQQIDPSSPGFRVACKGLIDDTMKKVASGQPLLKRSEPTSQYKTFIVGNEHCFTLPFRSTSRHFLSCDEHSSVIHTRRGGSNGDSCTSKYFENSLHDTIGKELIIINGMDVNTLMPDKWLNDAIVNFWIKWVSVPRSPNDLASKVHVFSSHFLSSVLTNNYSPGLKRWLRKINIFEKKLLLFPFHGAGHWSL
eukprot:scaffold19800_cov87-Skeletonema_marinoi.AAC.1